MYKKLVCLMFVVLVAASMFGCNLFDFGKKETREAAEKEEKISEQIKELENNSEKLSIGNFYEIYALMDSGIDVRLVAKKNIDYSDEKYFEFEFTVTNRTKFPIAAIEGVAMFKDLQGNVIDARACIFCGEEIPAYDSITVKKVIKNNESKLFDGWDDIKLHDTEFEMMELAYEATCIIFSNGTMVSYG